MDRASLVNAIEARLKTIKKTGGYATDAGNHVFTWRKTPVTVKETPCILLYDNAAESSDDADTIGGRLHNLTVTIIGMTSNKTSASQARSLLADIFKAVGTDNGSFGGAANWSDPVAHEINLETDGDVTAAAKVTLQVAYRTDRWGV